METQCASPHPVIAGDVCKKCGTDRIYSFCYTSEYFALDKREPEASDDSAFFEKPTRCIRIFENSNSWVLINDNPKQWLYFRVDIDPTLNQNALPPVLDLEAWIAHSRGCGYTRAISPVHKLDPLFPMVDNNKPIACDFVLSMDMRGSRITVPESSLKVWSGAERKKINREKMADIRRKKPKVEMSE